MPTIKITVDGVDYIREASDDELSGLSAARLRAQAANDSVVPPDDVAYLENRVAGHCQRSGEDPLIVMDRALESWVGWKA